MVLEIESTENGAELLSIKLNGVEKLHQGAKVLNNLGEVYWKNHSSILFPIIGRLKDNKTIINKKEYTMMQHGFARELEFEVIEKTDKLHRYVLKSNDYTKKMYPFKFELYVTYQVIENSLVTKYKVINKDRKEMLFGIGGQPAFICDVDSNNYYIEFENEEKDINILRLQRGLVTYGNKIIDKNIIKNNKYIELGDNTFDFGTIIFENIFSNKIYLKCKEHERDILIFDFTDFPYLALWSKPQAPFISICPWQAIPDRKETNSIFSTKDNIIHLKSNDKFECSYTITF